MDLHYFLEQKLRFIEYFSSAATTLFLETKKKIEDGVEPYEWRHAVQTEDYPFQEEWEFADASLDTVGAAALDYLQATLHSFLRTYLQETGNAHVAERIKEFGKRSWLENYRRCFQFCFNIDWAASGADLGLIEHLILTRNDFTHGSHLLSLATFQDDEHAEKHPAAAFVDERWKNSTLMGKKLSAPLESIREAIASVRSLCLYLESQRTNNMPVCQFPTKVPVTRRLISPTGKRRSARQKPSPPTSQP